jgi:uncharacterized OsmC-like protein
MNKMRNGVDLEKVEALVAAVKDNPAVGKVRFVARSEWKGGTKAEVTIAELHAGEQNIAAPTRRFKMVVDEPPELGGADVAPNPVEYLAAGLCGCLTAGIATNAALFETDLSKIEVTVEADYDIRGLLGLDRSVPTGASGIHYKVRIKGNAPADKLRRSKETIDRKSPVLNTLSSPIKITTEVEIED